jgi:hypothetical protein
LEQSEPLEAISDANSPIYETNEAREKRLSEKLHDFIAKMPENCTLVTNGGLKSRDLKKLSDIVDGIGASEWDCVKEEFGYFCDYYGTYKKEPTTLFAFFRRVPYYGGWWAGKCEKYTQQQEKSTLTDKNEEVTSDTDASDTLASPKKRDLSDVGTLADVTLRDLQGLEMLPATNFTPLIEQKAPT